MNIALKLSYDGTRYHGWQRQNNGDTIQQTLEEAIGRLLKTKVTVSGAGRTDAGVHAKRYVANFHAGCHIPLERLPFALNAQLPNDIAVWQATEVPETFDARFQCTKKEYLYQLYSSPMHDPFLANRAYRFPYPLEVSRMHAGAQHFVGRQDFASVRSQGTPVSSTVRTIFHCNVTETEGLISIHVCGDGFLYNMVRAIAGTLVYVGSGKLEPEDIPHILKACDRELAGPTLPACGLFMNRLWYTGTPQLDAFCLDM